MRTFPRISAVYQRPSRSQLKVDPVHWNLTPPWPCPLSGWRPSSIHRPPRLPRFDCFESKPDVQPNPWHGVIASKPLFQLKLRVGGSEPCVGVEPRLVTCL
jgi:hypothetical protein